MAPNQMASTPVNLGLLLGADVFAAGKGIILPSTFLDGVIPPLYLSRQEKPFGGIDPELVARASLYSAILKRREEEKRSQELQAQPPLYLANQEY